MKGSIVACAVLIIMIALAAINTSMLRDIQDQVAFSIERSLDFAKEGDLERAGIDFRDAKRVWEDKLWMIEATVECGQLSEVTKYFIEAESELENGSIGSFTAKCRLIGLCVRETIEEQHLTLKNIF